MVSRIVLGRNVHFLCAFLTTEGNLEIILSWNDNRGGLCGVVSGKPVWYWDLLWLTSV